MLNKSYLGIYLICFMMLMNLNFLFKIRLEKEIYVPLELFMGIFTLFHLKYINKVFLYFTIFMFFPYAVVMIYFVNYPMYHIFYILTLLSKLFFLNVVINIDYDTDCYRKYHLYILVFLVATLSLSILHLFIGINSPAPGWLWPINISIQEMTLLVLFATLLLYPANKMLGVVIFLFVILLTFRGSGKTSLALVIMMPCITFLLNRIWRYSLVSQYFVMIYAFFFILIVFYLSYVQYDFIVSGYFSVSDISSEKIDFYKRISLIYESLYLLTDPYHFLFGVGFGVVNYLSNIDSLLNNSPQVLPLTILVYGGLFFYFYFFLVIQCLLNNLLNRIDDVKIKNATIVLWISFIIFMTTHEYFNNPFLYISIYIYIVVAKSKDKVINGI